MGCSHLKTNVTTISKPGNKLWFWCCCCRMLWYQFPDLWKTLSNITLVLHLCETAYEARKCSSTLEGGYPMTEFWQRFLRRLLADVMKARRARSRQRVQISYSHMPHQWDAYPENYFLSLQHEWYCDTSQPASQPAIVVLQGLHSPHSVTSRFQPSFCSTLKYEIRVLWVLSTAIIRHLCGHFQFHIQSTIGSNRGPVSFG
jgi:hypothetical protein